MGGEGLVLNGALQVFLVGLSGGSAIEAAKWYGLRKAEHWPAYSRRPRYWLMTLVMVLIGGGLAVLYGTDGQSAILVFNIGASAPALIRTITPPERGTSEVAPAPAEPPRSGRGRRRGAPRRSGGTPSPTADPSIRAFLAGRR